MSLRIAKLKNAIETMHSYTAWHVASEPGIEFFNGEVAWHGVVEAFQLVGRPKAKRCHDSSWEENDKTYYAIVLGLPPVDLPETTVKVAIAAQAKGKV